MLFVMVLGTLSGAESRDDAIRSDEKRADEAVTRIFVSFIAIMPNLLRLPADQALNDRSMCIGTCAQGLHH